MTFTRFYSVAICVPIIMLYEWSFKRSKAELNNKLEEKNFKIIEDISQL